MSRRSPDSCFQVARSEETVYVRVVGLGTMNNATTFQGFSDAMDRKGYRHLIVDLEDCPGVDSTFMGMLLGLSGRDGQLVIVNTSKHCRNQMASVGLDHVLTFSDEPHELPRGVRMAEWPPGAQHSGDRVKLIMRAHKELIRIDRRNEAKFGAFLRAMTQQLGEEGED